MSYRMVELPSDEPVQFVGVYVLKWRDVIAGDLLEPTAGFIEVPLNEAQILNDVADEIRPKDLVYAREIDKLFDELVGDYVTHDENGEII